MKKLEFKPEDFQNIIHEGCECDLTEYDAARIAQKKFDQWFEDRENLDELLEQECQKIAVYFGFDTKIKLK